jgi:hypothetical protein
MRASLAMVVLILIALMRPAAAADKVGMACQVTGKPEYLAGGKEAPKPLHMLQKLEPGDKIRCGAGSSAIVVLFGSGVRFEVGANQTGTIQVAKIDGAKSLGGLSGPSAETVKTLAGSRSGALFSRAPMLSQRLTRTFPGWKVEGDRKIAWEAVEGATSYSFALYDAVDVVWQQRVSMPETEYPSDLNLDLGKPYLWQLVAYKGEKRLLNGMKWGVITYLSKEASDQMKAEVKTLEEERLANPKDPVPVLLLADLYKKYGVLMGTLLMLDDKLSEILPREYTDVIDQARTDVYRQLGDFAFVFSGKLKEKLEAHN